MVYSYLPDDAEVGAPPDPLAGLADLSAQQAQKAATQLMGRGAASEVAPTPVVCKNCKQIVQQVG